MHKNIFQWWDFFLENVVIFTLAAEPSPKKPNQTSFQKANFTYPYLHPAKSIETFTEPYHYYFYLAILQLSPME